jgi:hypothetical protein
VNIGARKVSMVGIAAMIPIAAYCRKTLAADAELKTTPTHCSNPRVRYPMADLTIAELREIGKKMTPGPWEVYCDLNVRCDDPRGGKMYPLTTSGLSNEVRTANYEGIVHMRNLWDSLLDRLEAAEQPWVEVTTPPDWDGIKDYVHVRVCGPKIEVYMFECDAYFYGQCDAIFDGNDYWAGGKVITEHVKYWRTLVTLPK